MLTEDRSVNQLVRLVSLSEHRSWFDTRHSGIRSFFVCVAVRTQVVEKGDFCIAA